MTSFEAASQSMSLLPVTEGEVARVMQSFSSKKSCDVSGVSMWLLKQCSKHLTKPLTKLINLSFATGTFPQLLKTAKVVPIYKKDDPHKTNNYRPISILPSLSKIFEKTFCERLVSFLEHSRILSPEQFGFRKGRSTIDAVNNLLDSVVDGLERREQVLSIFLDLSKAFDCVHHETLVHQLKSCGVRGIPLKWLVSYLENREQCVEISNIFSNKVKMTYGVPQGSILGPVLFLIYVNKLKSSVQKGQIVQYADDTTLCFKAKSIQELEITSFIELNSCIQHFDDINLKTNCSKSNFIKFSLRQQDTSQHPVVMLENELLAESESAKFLGMYLDRGLTWEDHVDSICLKVASGIYALRNLAKTCTLEVLKMAYFGLIYPHFSYGIRLWGGCSKQKMERVFRLQKKAVRIIAKLKFRESCRDSFRELDLLTLPCLYVFDVILYCRSQCSLIQGRDVHQYETRGRDTFRIPQCRLTTCERLPSQVGVRFINKLPEGIKIIDNYKQFKTYLKLLLISKAFYSIDEFMMSRWDDPVL